MKVLLINQYFPPDVAPTGLMLERVGEELVEQGNEVTVLCANGRYADAKDSDRRIELTAGDEEVEPDWRVVRVGTTGFGRRTSIGKVADYAFFYIGVAKHLAFTDDKPDRIVALTTPPFLSILARLFSRIRGGDHAHWVMDLYPEVMVAHGMISSRGIVRRILSGLTRWGFGGKRCRMVLTLGPDMKELVAGHLERRTPSEWVPLWGTSHNEESNFKVANTDNRKLEKEVDSIQESRPLILMYSGNMGLGHRFGEFLDGSLVAGEKFLWKFHGQGKRRPEIENFIKENPSAPVELGDYVPRDELAAHLASADVHLASLEPAWDGTMVPSKLQGIFAIGRPVIFVGSATCAMGSWIKESDGGWIVPPGNLEVLGKVLDEAMDPNVRLGKGKNAQRFAEKHFCSRSNAPQIARFLSAK